MPYIGSGISRHKASYMPRPIPLTSSAMSVQWYCSYNLLTINAMTTADTILVPIQCEYYALEGLSQLIHTIDLIKERLNPNLEIEGVVFTMFDARTNLSLQVVENVKENLDRNIYKTIIPRNVRLAEAPSYGMPINMYDKRSSGAEAYRLLANEVVQYSANR